MNTSTNSTAATAIQTIAAHAGYNISGTEITAICALAGGAVHLLHTGVAAYGRAGGWRGIWNFIKTGKTAP